MSAPEGAARASPQGETLHFRPDSAGFTHPDVSAGALDLGLSHAQPFPSLFQAEQ